MRETSEGLQPARRQPPIWTGPRDAAPILSSSRAASQIGNNFHVRQQVRGSDDVGHTPTREGRSARAAGPRDGMSLGNAALSRRSPSRETVPGVVLFIGNVQKGQ